MNPADISQVMDITLNLNTIQPQQQNLTDGFGNLIDQALNTNRMFQQAPLMMMERPAVTDRAFSNSADLQPNTLQDFRNAVDRSKIMMVAESPTQVAPVPSENNNGGSEIDQMRSSMQESLKMMKDMNQRASLNNVMLTYAMANFTVLDTAVKSVSGAIDTLSRAQ